MNEEVPKYMCLRYVQYVYLVVHQISDVAQTKNSILMQSESLTKFLQLQCNYNFCCFFDRPAPPE